MKIGQLEIDLLANVARLQADMNEVKRSVGGSGVICTSASAHKSTSKFVRKASSVSVAR